MGKVGTVRATRHGGWLLIFCTRCGPTGVTREPGAQAAAEDYAAYHPSECGKRIDPRKQTS